MSDLIKREDAINATWQEPTYADPLNILTEVRDRIEAIPSADRPQGWIPCSERLPEDVQIGDEYPTVIFCTKENTYAGFYEYYLGGRWWAEDGDYVVDDVIAWMPLPEPWKGAENDKA